MTAAIGTTVRPGAAGRFAPFEGASGFRVPQRICSRCLSPRPAAFLTVLWVPISRA